MSKGRRKAERNSLFTPEIIKRLDERERQMAAGKYVEIKDLKQFRKRIKHA